MYVDYLQINLHVSNVPKIFQGHSALVMYEIDYLNIRLPDCRLNLNETLLIDYSEHRENGKFHGITIRGKFVMDNGNMYYQFLDKAFIYLISK